MKVTLIALLLLAYGVAASAASVLVKTVAMGQQTITESLDVYGVLEPDPDQVLAIALPHAGTINRVWVRHGQRVNNGDKLLELLTSPEANMQYLQARNALAYAQREVDRQQRLFDDQLATRTQLDNARTALSDAESLLASLHSRGMDSAGDTITTPFDGIVIGVEVRQGQRVTADTVAILVAAERQVIARLGIEPEELPRVTAGQAVTVTPVFGNGPGVESVLREVHAMIDPATHLLAVLVPIPEHQTKDLILGSRVHGRIVLSAHDGLVVPRNAVLYENGTEGAYVYRVSGNLAQRVRVTTGLEQGELIEVSGNLAVSDRIVVAGNYELEDGMKVREGP